jgi:hypothetical protein
VAKISRTRDSEHPAAELQNRQRKVMANTNTSYVPVPPGEKTYTWWRIKDVLVFRMSSGKIYRCFPACDMLS